MTLADTTYLRFEEWPLPNQKTKVVDVISVRSGARLGQIKWWGAWRQYTFFPEPETVWNPACLDAVNSALVALMAERRAKADA